MMFSAAAAQPVRIDTTRPWSYAFGLGLMLNTWPSTHLPMRGKRNGSADATAPLSPATITVASGSKRSTRSTSP